MLWKTISVSVTRARFRISFASIMLFGTRTYGGPTDSNICVENIFVDIKPKHALETASCPRLKVITSISRHSVASCPQVFHTYLLRDKHKKESKNNKNKGKLLIFSIRTHIHAYVHACALVPLHTQDTQTYPREVWPRGHLTFTKVNKSVRSFEGRLKIAQMIERLSSTRGMTAHDRNRRSSRPGVSGLQIAHVQ